MAVVADGNIPVGTVGPVIKVGIHDMAVDTGFRIIRKVRVSSGNIEGIESKSKENAKQHRNRGFPLFRWDECPKKFSHSEMFIKISLFLSCSNQFSSHLPA
jgi:hypothetical protein